MARNNNTITKICPTCEGKGYLQEYVEEILEGVSTSVKKESSDCVLPKIKGPKNSKPSRSSRHMWRKSEITLPLLPSKGMPSSGHRAAIKRSQLNNSTIKRELSEPSNNSSDSLREFEVPHREIKNLPNFIKVTKMKLKGSSLDDITYGIINTVHIARKDSDYALTFMPQVNRHLCTLLKSMKPYYTQVAYKIIKELFQRVPLISRPEFDEMIQLLLGKVSDLKNSIRDGANDALDVITANTRPPYTSTLIRAITLKGPRSKNPFVRETTARILDQVVDSVGPSLIMTAYNLREIRRSILMCGLQFLEDQSSSVRLLGKQLMSKLIATPEFEDIILSDVPQQLYNRVERCVLSIKYEKNTK